ncbi:PPO candidate 1 [gamma proteobacterium IMCC2047]|nr:PPO candidate 1 [gamma proteobacterium IMCC2047]
MARTESNMLALGTQAPSFELPDTVSGNTLTLQQLRGERATVIMFICNHCPFVIHVQHELCKLAQDYQPKGVNFIAISANDVDTYPQDAPANMAVFAAQNGFNFPYLYDESQRIAKAYDAACTPDFYLFDANLRCIYRGQLDDSRPGNGIPVNGLDLRRAINALLAGKPIDQNQKPSLGCNIKWKT